MVARSFIFASFLLLDSIPLLIIPFLSTPVISSLYLIYFIDASSANFLQAGILGYCALGMGSSTRRRAGLGLDGCSKPSLGYDIYYDINLDFDTMDVLNYINAPVTRSFVMLPLTALCALLAAIASLFATRSSSSTGRTASLFASLLAVAAAGFATASFVVMAVIVGHARSSMANDGSLFGAEARWGNAVWITLGAVIDLWLAAACCCWGAWRARRKTKW